MKENFFLFFFNLYQKFSNSPYLKLVIVLLLAFFFILLLSLVRKHVFQISMRGAVFGFFLGVILVLFFDLIVIFAISDRTQLQGLFSKEERQGAFREVMISGVSNLNKILGVSTFVSPRKPKTAQEVISEILLLPSGEIQKVKNLLCPE